MSVYLSYECVQVSVYLSAILRSIGVQVSVYLSAILRSILWSSSECIFKCNIEKYFMEFK